MALAERGTLTLDTKKGWTIEADEGIISLADEINKTVNAEARRKKKSRVLVNTELQAELEKFKNKQVDLRLSDDGDFKVIDLKAVQI